MPVRFARETDRLHVRTGRVEWTILNRFVGQRGPCYISDVRDGTRPLLTDQDGAYDPAQSPVNHPARGGLFGFGVIAARQEAAAAEGDEFWRHAWDLTTRLDGAGGFGVTKPRVRQTGPYRAGASCELHVQGQPCLALQWTYLFGDGPPRVDVFFTALSLTNGNGPALWAKEPKLVVHGLTGYRWLSVLDRVGAPLAPWRYDLHQLTDPAAHTRQIPDPARRRVRFEADGDRPQFEVTNDQGLDIWRQRRDLLPPLTTGHSPAYCLDHAGGLKAQWEAARIAGVDRQGVMMHVDEGGYGAPDCRVCFRPWPTLGEAFAARLTATVGR